MNHGADHLPPIAVAARRVGGVDRERGVPALVAGHAARAVALREAGISDRRCTLQSFRGARLGNMNERAAMSGGAPRWWDQRPPMYMSGASFPACGGLLGGYR